MFAASFTTMARRQASSGLRQLRDLFKVGTTAGVTDNELLERFVRKRAESEDAERAAEFAFAALVNRHGAMVWGVCRRVLGDVHEAEDAFQATFLVLARKAGSVHVGSSLGRWLYGVAQRVALRARSQRRRQEVNLLLAEATASDDPADMAVRADLRRAIGEELDRLPAKYRSPIELCYLQGLTYEQAAERLKWPVATVKSRLTRGRTRLRGRLVQRGLAPLATTAFTAFAGESWAVVPESLVQTTIREATRFACGEAPLALNDLTREVLKAMAWEKLKWTAAGFLGAVGLAAGALAQSSSKDSAPTPPPTAKSGSQPETIGRKPLRNARWVKTLPNGTTFEVVGVSQHPSGHDTWWYPDGKAMQRPPCDPSPTKILSDDGFVNRMVVARITHVPATADYHWRVVGARSNSGGESRREGKPVPELHEFVAEFPPDLKSCTVRFEMAAGPWKTSQTWARSQGAIGNRFGPSYIFSAPIATTTGTVLAVTHNIPNTLAVRLVAVDGNGQERAAKPKSGSGVGDFHQLVGEFDLPVNQIREFRVQTRPFEQIEIKDIALNPLPGGI
jgi:RNA polymerase sigma factor (sigma-70 family)